MSEFSYKAQELDVLKNFQVINNSAIIKPTQLATSTTGKTIIALYEFENEYEYDAYGIYDMQQFNQMLTSFKEVNLEVTDNSVIVKDVNSKHKVNYRTTPIDAGIITEVKDPTDKFNKIEATVKFTFPSSDFQAIKKLGDILKLERIYIQSNEDTGDIKVTGAGTNLSRSENVFEEVIASNNVETNELSDKVLFFKRDEFNMILPGNDYQVEIAIHPKTGSCLSRWTNSIMPGLVYYIALEEYEV